MSGPFFVTRLSGAFGPPQASTPAFDPVSAAPWPAPPGSSLKPLPDHCLTGDWIRRRFLYPPATWPVEAEPHVESPSSQSDAVLSSSGPVAAAHHEQAQAHLQVALPAVPAGLTAAAVLIPLLPQPLGLSVLLTLRSARLRQHRGQIAFPGGRLDPDDPSVEAAALREAYEEVGLGGGQVQILGRLPALATVTGFWITPVVGLLDEGVSLPSLSLSRAEVEEAFLVPLSFLMDPAHHQWRLAVWQQQGHRCQRVFQAIPWRAPDGRDRFIWGATATMLRNLYHFLAV